MGQKAKTMNDVDEKSLKYIVLGACCAAIFWPGTLIFGFPGVMSQYWQMVFKVGPSEVGQILFFILAPVGLFMFFIGRLLERWKPQWLIGIGALICFGSTSLLPLAGSFSGVYLWAFVMGSSTAMIYLSGLTVVQRWFPERRGLVSGVFNMFFGGSAALLSPVYNHVLCVLGYSWVTMGAALCVLIFGLISAALIRFPLPHNGYGYERSVDTPKIFLLSMTVVESLKTRSFWMLWFTWAFAGAAGISMITLSPAFGKARGLSPHEAVLLLTAFNVTNGISRVISGYASDYVGRRMTLTLSFVAAGTAYFFMARTGSVSLWLALSAVIGFGFGTLFAVSAPLVGDCFGMNHFSAILGMVFTAYGFVAGIIGPWLSGQILDITGGNFAAIFTYLGALMLSAAGMILLTRPQTECILPVR
jgi:OFA family oxalate/formate antiporter-like MFS transporter